MPADTDWSDANIIVGTLGNSEAIDSLAEMGTIDVSEIKDKGESFTVQENGNLIAGSDKRGTIYGIYDFCEKNRCVTMEMVGGRKARKSGRIIYQSS